jgi:hypothetical protein
VFWRVLREDEALVDRLTAALARMTQVGVRDALPG